MLVGDAPNGLRIQVWWAASSKLRYTTPPVAHERPLEAGFDYTVVASEPGRMA